jgi:hypothetical protein
MQGGPDGSMPWSSVYWSLCWNLTREEAVARWNTRVHPSTRPYYVAGQISDIAAEAFKKPGSISVIDHAPVITPIGWQPIETAPRDGTDFLCWDELSCDVVRYFGEDPEMMWFNGDCFVEPTHWMPLPDHSAS